MTVLWESRLGANWALGGWWESMWGAIYRIAV